MPYFQPWIDLSDQSIAGMEVLVRWRHPELGLVPPMRFIPVAEEAGLIAAVGEQVIRAACQQLRAWDAAGLACAGVGGEPVADAVPRTRVSLM